MYSLLTITTLFAAQPVDISFDGEPLREVVAHMAEKLDENFVYSSAFRGDTPVTVVAQDPVSPEQARAIFLSVLASEGYTTHTVHGMTKIIPLD